MNLQRRIELLSRSAPLPLVVPAGIFCALWLYQRKGRPKPAAEASRKRSLVVAEVS